MLLRHKLSNVTIFSSSAVVVAVVFTLVIALCFRWSLHSESLVGADPSDNSRVDINVWQEPQGLPVSNRFTDQISNHYWAFSVDELEAQLLAINTNQYGDLILNEQAAKRFENAVLSLPKDMDELALQRLQLLVKKGWVGKTGDQLATLLLRFCHYHQASNSDIASASMKSQKQQFQETIQRQHNFFGHDIAQQLFGRKNAITRYLFARKEINENASLSAAQKQQRLSKLQAGFKAHDE